MRPASTYRAARRRQVGSTWGPNWYVPKHRANDAVGWPSFRPPPGRWPKSMRGLQAAWLEMKKQARLKAAALRKVALGGGR